MKESKSFVSKEKIILYHGSCYTVEFPEVRKSRFTKDFSWGFYTTIVKAQAEKWSKRGNSKNVVSKYEYQENSNLSILKFESMTEDWLDFVIDCREGKIHGYDIVEGPMADDKLFFFIDDYINGNISEETFWSYSKFKHPTHQLSFHSLEALDCLKFIESYEVINNGV